MLSASKDKIVIYDGHCALCDSAVTFLLKADKEHRFYYTPLQGEYVKSLEIDKHIDSIVFYDAGRVYYKSTAVLRIASSLGGIWKLSALFYLIPEGVRDWCYDRVAKYRYKIFSRREQCRIPTKEEAPYFLD